MLLTSLFLELSPYFLHTNKFPYLISWAFLHFQMPIYKLAHKTKKNIYKWKPKRYKICKLSSNTIWYGLLKPRTRLFTIVI